MLKIYAFLSFEFTVDHKQFITSRDKYNKQPVKMYSNTTLDTRGYGWDESCLKRGPLKMKIS